MYFEVCFIFIFLGGQPRLPTPRGRGPSVPKSCCPVPYVCPNSLTNSDKIWCDNRWGRIVFTGVRYAPIPSGCRAPASPKFLGPPTYAQMVWSRTTKFGEITDVGQLHPVPRGQGPSIPKFWASYMCAHSMRNDNQILHDDQLDVKKILTGSATNADMQSVCMLTFLCECHSCLLYFPASKLLHYLLLITA